MLRTLILAAVSVLVCATGLRAQETNLDGQSDLVFSNVPLRLALETLISQSRIDLIYENRLVEGRKSFCKTSDRSIEAVLSCILRDTGLDFYRLSSGTYVISNPPLRESPGQISGRVIDAASGAAVSDAHVILRDARSLVTTNRAGRFALADLRPGPHQVSVTHLAFEPFTDTVYVTPGGSRRLSLELRPRTHVAAPVVVTGLSHRISPLLELGRGALDHDRLPVGRSGRIRVVAQSLGGIHTGNSLSDLHVQGGSSGEHRFQFDDAVLFVPVTNAGLVSPLSPLAIRQITVRKAGYGSPYGSQLAGLIDIEQEFAPSDTSTAVLEINRLSANARFAGRFSAGRSVDVHWLTAARRSVWDLYEPGYLKQLLGEWSRPDPFLAEALGAPAGQVVDETSSTFDLDFQDYHGALLFDFDGLQTLKLSYYEGRNHFSNHAGDGNSDRYEWWNSIAQVRFESILSGRSAIRTAGWVSEYELRHPFDRSPFTVTCQADCSGTRASDFNEIDEMGVRVEVDYAVGHRHFISGGIEGVNVDSDVTAAIQPQPFLASEPVNRGTTQWRFSTYLQDTWSMTLRTELEAGSRLTFLPATDAFYAEPRISLRHDLSLPQPRALTLEAGGGVYRQFLHQFDVSTYDANAWIPAIRFWLPVTTGERPPKAYHVTTAALFSPTPEWDLSAEAFFKYMPHLTVVNYGDLARGVVSTTAFLANGKGRDRGLSLSAKREWRRFQTTIGYDYERSRRRILNRFAGEWVPTPWNTPHRLRAGAGFSPISGLVMRVRWEAQFRRSWALRQSYYDYLEPDPETRRFGSFDLSEPGLHELPAFSRLDLGGAYSFTIGEASVRAGFEIINVTDRQNVSDERLVNSEDASSYMTVSRPMLPRTWSASLRLQL